MSICKKLGYVGIDYSMSCPTACFHPKDVGFSADSCSWLFLTDQVKYHGFFHEGRIRGLPIGEWNCFEQRYDNISKPFHEFSKNTCGVAIEDYAAGAKGKVFNIAENTSVLKHGLWKMGIPISVASPKTIKKFATGNGNSDKNMMYEQFVKDTGIRLTEILNYNKIPAKMSSPVSDIVDSFYICKYIYEQLTI